MNMTLKYKNLILCLLTILAVIACSDDDNSDNPEFSENDRTEQQMIDNDSLLGFFETHYYNADFLDSQENIDILDIEIIEASIDGNGNPIVPAGYKLLVDEMVDGGKLLTIEDPVLYEDTEYTYYVLNLNQGGGDFQPGFADSIQLVYEGSLMDGQVFDSQYVLSPVFTLTGLIEGWKRIIPLFNTAEDFENVDGFTFYKNYGTGVMFIPSGLGYFSRQQGEFIAPYSNLIFKFGLMTGRENDDDSDSIGSTFEDLNNNYDLLDDDTDEDGIPNAFDVDDENDLVGTIDEDIDGDGNPLNDDTDGDGIPNYLDDDDDGDGVPTANEDIDGDGDPTNDIGANGIPKYLDPTETESNDPNA